MHKRRQGEEKKEGRERGEEKGRQRSGK